ncbi:response regulator [Candidatus Gracilibacteria bacterium]|nr:response regulator [Candidatus Gracilibacteria bacterium]
MALPPLNPLANLNFATLRSAVAPAISANIPTTVARILVSDDDVDIRRFYSALLPPLGFELIAVPRGEGLRTVELADRVRPDLLITDANKPGIDGYTICRELREDPRTRSINTLMVSAIDEWLQQRSGQQLRADDHLLKPFAIEMLLYRVISLLALDNAALGHVLRQTLITASDAPYHPLTGLPSVHELATALPTLTARGNWTALHVAIPHFSALVRAYGRAQADSLLLNLVGQLRRGPARVHLAHFGLGTDLLVLCAPDDSDALLKRIVPQFAAHARTHLPIFLDGRPALNCDLQLCVRRVNGSATLDKLSALWDALA